MPINSYYKGHGEQVMRSMRAEYGSEKKAKQVFYATANARKSSSRRVKVRRAKS